MAIIMEICLEELEPNTAEEVRGEEPFIRCVAMPGGDPGLSLDRGGQVRWMPEEPAVYGLWTSEDHRLVLLRGQNTQPITVERDGRSLEAPEGKPVILLDRDVLHLDGKSYRVYFHGETEAIYEPERLSRSALGKVVGAAAAASMALGGLMGAPATAGADKPEAKDIEVRLQPPKPAPRRRRVFCSIQKQKKTSKGLEIHATCSRSRGLKKGLWGNVVKKKDGKRVKNGTVQIKSVKGKTIKALASKLTKPVKDARLQFWVRFY